jgi:hypothetical protein
MAILASTRRNVLNSLIDRIARTALAGVILTAVAAAPSQAITERDTPVGFQQEVAKPAPDPIPRAPNQTKDGGDPARDEAVKLLPHPPDDKRATRVNVFTGLGMVSSAEYKPLDRHRRWEYYVSQNFTSIGSYFGPVAASLIDQIGGQPPEWGGGVGGYGRRLASRLGTDVIQGTVQSAGAAALGQEPRYIRSSDSGIAHRIGHAFVYSLITYNNEGKNRPALATVGSYYASSMLANTWYPGRFTALGDGVRDGNRQVILASLMNQFQEFWPEIRRYVLRRK